MGVDPLDHVIGPMAQLARDGVDRDRGTPVERLEPRGAVRVSEGLRPRLAGAEARALRGPIEQPVDWISGGDGSSRAPSSPVPDPVSPRPRPSGTRGTAARDSLRLEAPPPAPPPPRPAQSGRGRLLEAHEVSNRVLLRKAQRPVGAAEPPPLPGSYPRPRGGPLGVVDLR